MNKRLQSTQTLATLALALLATPFAAGAQVPVDEDGKLIGNYEAADAAVHAVGNEDIPLLTSVELEELVGPIALYPDDLLAIVLPAAAYPLQLIDAGRFLDELENDSSLKPDQEWDDSIVALLNYPEVIELLNEDIDWTWRLGEAVVAQQGDVVGAIESFRDRAYAAGNLKSDDYQEVNYNDGVIEITPVSDDVIYVPYYEPERVVIYQPRPVYYYYPRAYPVYYYPYSSSYAFDRGYFWGVTTAFTIGWLTDSLHVYHHSYRGHPYYRHRYNDYYWYRRPSINVYNTTYVRNTNVTINRYYRGDRWQPRRDRRDYIRETQPRVMNTYRAGHDYTRRDAAQRDVIRRNPQRHEQRAEGHASRKTARNEAIRFRERPETRAERRTERRSPLTRQRSERREPLTRQRSERREPVARQRTQRREPVARQRTERRDQVARQKIERRQPAVRQRMERREPMARQRSERRQPAVTQRESRPQPRRSEPKRAEYRRSENRPAENRKSENRERPERRKARRSER